jgi:hypothetical protein
LLPFGKYSRCSRWIIKINILISFSISLQYQNEKIFDNIYIGMRREYLVFISKPLNPHPLSLMHPTQVIFYLPGSTLNIFRVSISKLKTI